MANNIGTIILIILIIVVGVYFLSGKNDNWIGFYYPNRNNSGEAIYSPQFKTKEKCIAWAENTWDSRLSDRNIDPQDLYECGKNCVLQSWGLYICDVAFDGGDWRRGDYGGVKYKEIKIPQLNYR